jgi:hypothetical protein
VFRPTTSAHHHANTPAFFAAPVLVPKNVGSLTLEAMKLVLSTLIKQAMTGGA